MLILCCIEPQSVHYVRICTVGIMVVHCFPRSVPKAKTLNFEIWRVENMAEKAKARICTDHVAHAACASAKF